MKLSLNKLSPASAFAAEALGLLALFLAPDVESLVFLAPLLLAALAYFGKVRLRDRLLLLLVALVVVAGYATALGEPTGTVLTRSLIPAHALLWLAAAEAGYRFWRLGIALMELVLAAILAPEAHMFVLIFFFVVMSSLALALGFIENNFRRREPEALRRPLKPFFLWSLLALSGIVFLSSLLIFPLLPRSRWSGDHNTNVGYNEVVSFRQGILRWAQLESRPALWVFRASGQPWESLIPYFLLRGQALEQFNGDEWKSESRDGAEPGESFDDDENILEITRQPMPTDALPVPYGTGDVAPGTRFLPTRSAEGEWFVSEGRTRSLKYRLETGQFSQDVLGEAPSPATKLFDAENFPEIAALANSLNAGALSDQEKILVVQKYFGGGGFAAELVAVPAHVRGQRHPIERFLFDTKKGHCELFASSAALLLRSLRVPARLVVGFRVRPPQRGNVLTVHNSDAHAWVEAWQSGRGWVPLDITPVSSQRGWVPEIFGEGYDWLQAYWHRYILDYEFDRDALGEWLKWGGAVLAALAALATIVWAWRNFFGGVRGEREKLAEIYAQFEDDLLHRAGVYPETAYREMADAQKWLADYTELRFGREPPLPEWSAQMKKRARAIVTKAAQELEAAG